MDAQDHYEVALKIERSSKADWKQVVEHLKLAEQSNHPDATYALATFYLHGKYLEKDPSTAAKLLEKACELGSSSACFDLAVSSEKGVGVLQDEKRAFGLYMKAMVLGDRSAIFEVARCCYYEIGVENLGAVYEVLEELRAELD